MRMQTISGNIVDVLQEKIYPGTLEIRDGRIISLRRDSRQYSTYIVPGLIDAHVHIESSMLVPAEFGRLAVIHGTVGVVSDPHEIANVLGIAGVRHMLSNSRMSPVTFCFGAPSCVPATAFETAGAHFGIAETEELLGDSAIAYLSEMMNYPGVISRDAGVMSRIALARRYGKCVDGHAPGLSGAQLQQYISAGITTDHEAIDREEALEKIRNGMKILIREGSAARNFSDLHYLIEEYSGACMFCSDDKHPDDLLRGHINEMVKRALGLGYDPMKVFRCASVNPVRHYGMDIGLLQEGDYADCAVVDNLRDFAILKTYIKGEAVAERGRSLIPRRDAEIINNFSAERKAASDFVLRQEGSHIRVIEVIDGQLVTNSVRLEPKVSGGWVISDIDRDILKITVVNRYRNERPAVAFVRNFGLKEGAIASSVSHDSHNVVAVGVTDEDIAHAVNTVIEFRGGLAVVRNGRSEVLPLPVAGLMTDEDGFQVAGNYAKMESLARNLGSGLRSPFMALSFMALPVIPKLKLTDRGLFDGEVFSFVDLFC